jgi:hypothetical protein
MVLKLDFLLLFLALKYRSVYLHHLNAGFVSSLYQTGMKQSELGFIGDLDDIMSFQVVYDTTLVTQ